MAGIGVEKRIHERSTTVLPKYRRVCDPETGGHIERAERWCCNLTPWALVHFYLRMEQLFLEKT